MSKYHSWGGSTYNLGTSISSTDTSILLSSFLVPVSGEQVTMALINSDIVYATIAPKTTSSEFISFTGIIANADGTSTLTGVTRGLNKTYPFTSDTSFKLPHSGQTQFIISDAPQVFEKYVTLEDTETITGIKTFTTSPTVPTATSSDIHEAASIEYVNNIALSGAPNASTTVKGIVQEATQAQVLAKTATGSTGAELYVNPSTLPSTLLSDYKVDTGSANAYAIAPSPAIIAYTVGQIFSFKAVNANTTASTLNVNGLGVKTIKNSLGGDVVANDILAGQIVVVEYDGTNFQMTSPLGNQTATALKSATTIVNVSAATAPTSGQVLKATSSTAATWQTLASTTSTNGTTTYAAQTVSGTQTIAHGLGRIPFYIRLCASGTSTFSSDGTWGPSSQFCVFNNGLITSPSTTFSVMISVGSSDGFYNTGVISADATNITITWTRVQFGIGGGTATYNILWSAIA